MYRLQIRIQPVENNVSFYPQVFNVTDADAQRIYDFAKSLHIEPEKPKTKCRKCGHEQYGGFSCDNCHDVWNYHAHVRT